MDKNIHTFDSWNQTKKELDNNTLPDNLFFYEREIWWCSIGLNIGIEANGKHLFFERPVLILHVFNKEMVWVIPVTSTLKNSPFYHRFRFRSTERSLMLTQIRVISTKRFRRKVDILSELDFEKVKEKLAHFLKSETPPYGGESRSPKALIK